MREPNLYNNIVSNHGNSNLCFRGDGSCGDSHCVDPSICILMDLNVRFLLSGFHIPRGVKQVQHFLIIQLQNRKVFDKALLRCLSFYLTPMGKHIRLTWRL